MLRRALLMSLCLTMSVSAAVQAETPQDPKKILQQGLQSGKDTRLPAWTDKHPWRCVGKVITKRGAFGTGTLVNNDIVLTNAHVVENRNGKIDFPIYFYPGYAEGPGRWVSRVQYVTRGKSGTGRDYAILRLRSPLGKKLGYLGLAKRSLSLVSSKSWKNRLFMIGYSSDLRRGEIASHYIGCSILGDAAEAGWYHDCDALPGSSGSGLMYLSDSGVKIVALHWGGLDPTFDNEVCVPVSAFWDTYLKKAKDKPYKYTTLHVTNSSKKKDVWASIVYPKKSGGKTNWVSKGYFKVAQGQSREITIQGDERYTGKIYWRAHGGGSRWDGKAEFAVDPKNKYDIEWSDRTDVKKRYGKMKFRERDVRYGTINAINLTSS